MTEKTNDMRDIRPGARRIARVSAKVFEWHGDTAPLPNRIATKATDILALDGAEMGGFAFYAWLVVEIETEDGAIGIGNAALSPHVTKAVVDRYLAPILMGADPFDVEYLWQSMYRRTMAFGRKGIAMIAISAVDIALWDLMGKLVDLPVFRLLGGRMKAAIPVYASKLYHQPPEDLAEEARRYKNEGYGAVKMRLGYGPADGALGMRLNQESVSLVREVVGTDVDVMVDAYMGWSLEYALAMLPRLEPYRLRWLEEAVIADDIAGYAALRKTGRVPIAGGEHEHTLYGFRQLLDAGALDYIQFDTNRVGGISQARKIIAMAEAFSIPVVPHAGQMHNYHLTMSSVICPIAEYFPPHPVEVGNELFWYLFDGEPQAEGGVVQLDDGMPGLGLTLSARHAEDFRVIE